MSVPRLAPAGTGSIGVIVPSPREVERLPQLVERLRSLRERASLDLALLIVDDGSHDGGRERVAAMGLPWVQHAEGATDRGPSQAVLEALLRCQREVLVVMDADLAHPPEQIPDLLEALADGADLVVGSRWVAGGSQDGRGPLRWLARRVATLLALPLTRLQDPRSGFFALRRSTLERGRELDPGSQALGLELLVKCGSRRVTEVPIRASGRGRREPLGEHLRYLKHLRRLYIFRYGTWSHLMQFLLVGATGVVVNLAVLTGALALGLHQQVGIALAIVLSMLWNFALNRRFSFSYARGGSLPRQLAGFVASCSLGAVVNYFTTLALWSTVDAKQLAAVMGVVAGTALNFVTARYLVFRRRPAGASR